MRIWAIGDLHLSFGIKDKKMDVFGPNWKDHEKKIEEHWNDLIANEDLVLIPGDISWAMRLEDAASDLLWIDSLPGTKVMIKGNHDYWWGSLNKVTQALPPSIHIIQNNAFFFNGIAVGGARLWDTPEYSFHRFINFQENPRAKTSSCEDEAIQQEKNLNIFNRELERLSLSLKQLNKDSDVQIAMTHYPPIGADLNSSKASQILEEHNINTCVFGHLHNLKPDTTLFGIKNGTRYILTSCDYLHFKPVQIL